MESQENGAHHFVLKTLTQSMVMLSRKDCDVILFVLEQKQH